MIKNFLVNLSKKITLDKEAIWLFAILIVAFFLRFYHLGYRDFWYDEVSAVAYAKYPWANWNAPLYWTLLHYWVKFFGISEFSLRLPSVIFSSAAVGLTYLLGKELFGRKTGIFASIFIGLSPFHLWYAQEARDYSMVLFWGTLSSYLFYKALHGNSKRLWALFTLSSVAGIYTNYFYLVLLVAQSFFVIFDNKEDLKNTLPYLLMIALAFLPYSARFLDKFNSVRVKFWIPDPGRNSLIITLENFVLGFNGFPIVYSMSTVLAGILLVTAFARAHRENLTRQFNFCLFLSLLPICCIFIFSKVFFSIYLERGLILFSPYYYIILSLGLNYLHKLSKIISIAGLFLLFSISGYRYLNDYLTDNPSHHIGACLKGPIKPIVEFLNINAKKEDAVILASESITPPIIFYSNKAESNFEYIHYCGLKDQSRNSFDAIISRIASQSASNIFLVSANLWGGADSVHGYPLKVWCDKNLNLERIYEFDEISIFKYGYDLKPVS